jgi:TonB family protein
MKKLILIVGLLLAANGHAHDELFPTCPSPHDPHPAETEGNIQQYKAISKTPPIYPNRALTRGLEGSVILEYTINTEGRAIDIKVVDTSNTVFDRAAIQAVEKFVYEPSINLDTGLPIDTLGVMHAVTFSFEGYEEVLTLGGAADSWNRTINKIQSAKPKDAIRRIDRYLADEEEDIIRVALYYLRSLRAAEIEPRNLSTEKEDLQNAYTLLKDQISVHPNVVKLKSYVIPALAFMEMDTDNKKALALLEEAIRIAKQSNLPLSTRIYYSYSNFGVLAYNSGNWCRAYESFDAAINTAKKIGMEETPNLKKFRDMAKERL